jgi:hypothetical protein
MSFSTLEFEIPKDILDAVKFVKSKLSTIKPGERYHLKVHSSWTFDPDFGEPNWDNIEQVQLDLRQLNTDLFATLRWSEDPSTDTIINMYFDLIRLK